MAGKLRRLEEKTYPPGAGAPMSERRGEELLVIVAEGELSYADAGGRSEVLRSGRAIGISCGSGISFALFNQNAKPAKVIEAAFSPRFPGGSPSVEIHSKASFQKNYLRLVATGGAKHSGAKRFLKLNSDASVLMGELTPARVMDYAPSFGSARLLVLDGKIEAGGKAAMERGDSATFAGPAPTRLRCVRPARFVIADSSC